MSTPLKPSASTQTPFRRNTGGTSITTWRSDISPAPIRPNSIAPSFYAGGRGRDTHRTLLRGGARHDGRRLSGAHAAADQAHVERISQRAAIGRAPWRERVCQSL